MAGGVFAATGAVTSDSFSYPGTTASISANGNNNGIVWAIEKGTNELRAYNAATLAEIYTSDQAGARDSLGTAIKFSVPTVANGLVYTGTASTLNIYGLLTPVTQIPAVATNLTAAAPLSSGAITLSWTRNSTNESSFQIMRSPDGVTQWTQVGSAPEGSTSYADSYNAAASTKYYYEVIATNAAGSSAASNVASATTQAAAAGGWVDGDIGVTDPPGNASQSNGVFTVNGSGSGIGKTADNFHYVYQMLPGDGTIIARVDAIEDTNAGASAGVMIRGGLAKNAPFVGVVVTAENGVLLQARTSTGVAAVSTAGPSTVGAPFWVELVRAGNLYTGYSSLDGRTWTPIGSYTVAMSAPVYAGLSTTATNDGILANATIDNVAFTALPAAPVGLIATATSSTQVSLSWNRGSTNDNGFLIERSPDGVTNWTQIGTTATGVTTYNDMGLTPGSNWFYRVRAANATGDSGYSNVATAPAAGLPSAPTGLKTTLVSTTEIDLAWTDTASNATGYKVFRANSPTGTFSLIATLSSTAIGYQDHSPPLPSGTTETYDVQAYNSAGVSGLAAVSTATLAVAPTTVSATAGIAQIMVTWPASAGATSYNVYRSTISGGEGGTAYASGVSTTSYTDNSVTVGTAYYYTVAAVDAGGVGPISSAEGSAVATGVVGFSAHFDFGPPGSPVATGYTPIADTTTYTSTLGYGFLVGADLWQFDRGSLAGTNSLTEDFVQTDAGGATFLVNVPDGTYDVTPTMGDALWAHDDQGIYLQGVQVDTINSGANQYVSNTYSVTVTNGQIQFTYKDLGGVDLYDVLNGLDIVPTSGTTPTPGIPVLAAAADSGVSSTDGITNFDNSTAPHTLQFTVPGTVAGATVIVYANGASVGTAVATGTTTTITAGGNQALAAGIYSITARQTLPYEAQSSASVAGTFKIDTTAPAALSSPAGVTTAGGTSYSFTVTYSDASGVNIASLDSSDVLVTNAAGSFSQLATFVSAAPSGNGTSVTASYSFTPPTGAWNSNYNGTYTLTLQANQVGDVAGNQAGSSTLGSFSVNVPAGPFSAHFDFGPPGSPVATGYSPVAQSTTYTSTLGYGFLPARTCGNLIAER